MGLVRCKPWNSGALGKGGRVEIECSGLFYIRGGWSISVAYSDYSGLKLKHRNLKKQIKNSIKHAGVSVVEAHVGLRAEYAG